MRYEHFELDVADGVARLGLLGGGGPAGEVADEILDAVMRLQEDPAVRVILLQDAERPFDLAPDLDAIARRRGEGAGFDSLSPDLEAARRIVTMLQESARPVVAAARGAVRESGLGLYLAADVRLAATTATFTPPDLKRGLLPDWGLTFFLPRLIGPSRALELLWGHRTVGAREADRLGLVDRVWEEAAFEQELADFLARLSNLPQPAVRLAKLACQQSGHFDLTSMLSYEWEAQQQCWGSLETAEGMAAFLDGRDPRLAGPTTRDDEEE